MNNMIPIIRRDKKISQARLAKMIGVSPSYLCKIEKSLQQPSVDFVKKCSEILEVPENELFPDKINSKELIKIMSQKNNPLWVERRKLGMKQVELARLVKCSPSYLSKVENNQLVPTDFFQSQCSKVLKKKRSYLFPFIQKK
ncbi:MAG: helix-turn-helix domain-containing protein [Spirochaetes bacterium]|nr:helix-turn-helix domain-containing protein [Spirochaetota bacterium]MBN2770469.1 helix-turn-helix domain-containing protein [Spirochaetota bacterium]